MIRIHITGAPRSGTTLMQALMAACFANINAPKGEVRLWTHVPREGTICTKNPNDTFLAPLLIPLDPSLHFVFVVRDPRDVIVSRHYSAPDLFFTNLRIWREQARIARTLRDHPQFHIVRYEDLVTKPDEVQARLAHEMSFLVRTRPFSTYEGKEAEDQVEVDALNGARAVEPSRLGSWRDHMGRVKQQIKIHGSMDQNLIDFSYEKNSGWMEDLHYIERDETPSLTPEHLSAIKAASKQIKLWLHVGAYLRRRYLGF